MLENLHRSLTFWGGSFVFFVLLMFWRIIPKGLTINFYFEGNITEFMGMLAFNVKKVFGLIITTLWFVSKCFTVILLVFQMFLIKGSSLIQGPTLYDEKIPETFAAY